VIPVVLAAGEEGDADGSWLKAKTWDNHGQWMIHLFGLVSFFLTFFSLGQNSK
jgi:hypothetical protein